MALWVARGGRHGEREEYALENNVVTVGWEALQDLGTIESREGLTSLVQLTYPDQGRHTLGSWGGQIWAFINQIDVDDIVALPLKNQRGLIAFGRVTGPYRHVSDAPADAKHQRPVEWLAIDILRSRIDSDLLFSFGGAKTVFRVRRNNAEARIREMLGVENPPRPRNIGPSDGLDQEDEDAAVDLSVVATDQIIEFIGRKFRGHDLARLVAGVLRAQGYEARVSPPGADGGVDIVAGRGPMGFDPPRLCVQVKSGNEPVGVNVLRELQGVMKNYQAEQGLIVAWGGFKRTVDQEARQLYFVIRLWDQTNLVEAVQEAYDRLDDQFQAELPLKRTWMLLMDEGEG